MAATIKALERRAMNAVRDERIAKSRKKAESFYKALVETDMRASGGFYEFMLGSTAESRRRASEAFLEFWRTYAHSDTFDKDTEGTDDVRYQDVTFIDSRDFYKNKG